MIYIISCHRPDQAGPNDNWCTSGISVLTVNDDNVPASIKSAIYEHQFTDVNHPDYNPSLPVVIIPFQFSVAYPHNTSVTAAVIRQEFFPTGTGSLCDFFLENSWGAFNMREAWIANPVTVSRDTLFYINSAPDRDFTKHTGLMTEICQNSNVNWERIDANHDHHISRHEAQICFMLSAGKKGACRPADITISTQTGTYTINARFVFFDCKTNADPTRATDAIRYNFSVICHELGHGMFDLPDRYDSTGCASGRSGAYDMMNADCNKVHMSIYDKMKLGWIRPRILEKPSRRADGQRHCYTFPNSESTPAALILWDASQPNEYWIVENRFKGGSPRDGFDDQIPESGLAIWWVDETNNLLSLVDARDISKRPQTISYIAGTPQRNVVFKNRTGTRDSTFNMQFLRPSYNSTEFAIRAPSPEGAFMYAEF